MANDTAYSNKVVLEGIQKAFAQCSEVTVEAELKHKKTVDEFVAKLQKAYEKTQTTSTQFD